MKKPFFIISAWTESAFPRMRLLGVEGRAKDCDILLTSRYDSLTATCGEGMGLFLEWHDQSR